MVLFSFSIKDHIPPIQSGAKAQTTRILHKMRKNGAKPYSVGDKVQLYYRSWQKASCFNCIDKDCHFSAIHFPREYKPACKDHTNFFGESVITEVVHYWDGEYKRDGNELWEGTILHDISDEEKEEWAIADGFQGTKNTTAWRYACEWFTKSTGDPYWAYKNLDVIKWDGQQIARRVA